ncbi:hypothetical protein J3D45_001031 [Microbacterium foliorum]|uniref:hypothetical protein n=1 Tax=Microbacterium foliorum TaxID=104336 RepID=UPI00209FA2C3|nr:hypothetical protein [Microbacterium foliorum]MCP1428533.1 hypothetical protein [Microbacterium foliorum]
MESFVQLGDGLAIVEEVGRFRRGERRGKDGRIHIDVEWREVSPWAVENGLLTIFPLARSDGSDDAEEKMTALHRSLEMDFVHYFGGGGFHAEAPLDPDDGYGARLSRDPLISLPRAVWRVSDYAFTLVRAADPQVAGATTLSLHMFPADWRWPDRTNANTKRAASRRRRMAKQVQEVEIDWTWPVGADGSGA